MSNQQRDQAFRFAGVAFASVESYRAMPYVPVWLNPWRWAARRRALKRVTPALQSGEGIHQYESKNIAFEFTDVVLEDLGDRFKLGWEYTLRLHAAEPDEARKHAESFLDTRQEIAEYTIRSPKYDHID